MSEPNVKDQKLALMPVNRLLINMGMPIIVSMMLQAVYNIVDSAFVANIEETGEMALNALTLAFPIQMLMVAIGIGTGVGVNALLAKSMGQEDIEKACKTAGNGIFLIGVIYIIFFLFGIYGVNLYISTQTGNIIIKEFAIEYLRTCCIFSFGIFFFSLFEKVLQATGNSIYSTIAQITGAVINIVLDPILIYGYFGLPKFGVTGAAYATVIGQIASALCGLFLHLKINKEIKNGLVYMKPSVQIIKSIYSIGFPAIIAQALMSVMTYLLNIIFVRIGENVVTVYGLYYKMQQFILFAAFGIRDAITPIISFNYGMKSKERINDGIKYGVLYTTIIMLIGFAGLELLAIPLSNLFGLSRETKNLFISAMHIISLSFIFAGLNIAFQGIFQALESGKESLIISICRQLLFVIPIAYGFSIIAISGAVDTGIVWLTFPIAEILTVIVSLIFIKHVKKEKIGIL